MAVIKNTRRIWISRDECLGSNTIYFWDEDKKPRKNKKYSILQVGAFFFGNKSYVNLPIDKFEGLFGFIPKKGICELFDLSLGLIVEGAA